MSPEEVSDDVRSNRLAAWAVGTGIGLMALMVTWLIANRVLQMAIGSPEGPTIAFATAVCVGLVAVAVAAPRLAGVASAEGRSH